MKNILFKSTVVIIPVLLFSCEANNPETETPAVTNLGSPTQTEVVMDEGQAFLENNKSTEGVVVLPSGLQYLIMKEGDGPKPSLSDNVTTHYHGTLIDGTVFDSSVDRGQPATFPLNRVIKGWIEALQLMPLGSKWKLFVPAHLGYGNQPAPGGKIAPNSTLIFEVELLKIN